MCPPKVGPTSTVVACMKSRQTRCCEPLEIDTWLELFLSDCQFPKALWSGKFMLFKFLKMSVWREVYDYLKLSDHIFSHKKVPDILLEAKTTFASTSKNVLPGAVSESQYDYMHSAKKNAGCKPFSTGNYIVQAKINERSSVGKWYDTCSSVNVVYEWWWRA